MGTLVAGSRGSLAFRCALGFAVWGHALFFLALFGQLRAVPIAALIAIAIIGGALRARIDGVLVFGAFAAPLLAMTLRPPLAFDETLYHLPLVRALAESGQLRFLIDLRYPVFPLIHELLCVPLYLFAGDRATHVVALAEGVITAALLCDWGRRYDVRAGWLAAALFAGSPIVVHFVTTSYVEPALVLFITAGFYCLDRDEVAWAGLFLGTACSVKYFGGYFAVCGLIGVRRMRYVVATVAAALPVTLWLFLTTGDPLFPCLRPNLWMPAVPPATIATRIARTLALAWNVTLARGEVNTQPPFTPFFIPLVIILIIAARRHARARAIAWIAAGLVVIFAFLPQDSRYLMPLLPLLSIVGAVAIAPRLRTNTLAAIAAAPAVLYLAGVLVFRGLPPRDREPWLTRLVPEYAALQRAGKDAVYVCGAEQLKYYARGKLLGDFMGPFAYDAVLHGDVAANLRRIGMRDLLIAKRACSANAPAGFTLVYEDAAAQLWRDQRNQSLP